MNDFIISNLEKLKKNKIPNAEIDLRVLLNYSKYSKYSKNEIILSNFDLDQINIDLFNKVLNRRLSNEPISKIINKKNFWKDEFYVNEFVLDPRPETEGIVEESLKLIKHDAIVVNCARGGVVNEDAVKQALLNNELGGYGCDVYESEPQKDSIFAGMENVIMTPHIGAGTKEAQEKVAVQIAEQISNFFNNNKITNQVN